MATPLQQLRTRDPDPDPLELLFGNRGRTNGAQATTARDNTRVGQTFPTARGQLQEGALRALNGLFGLPKAFADDLKVMMEEGGETARKALRYGERHRMGAKEKLASLRATTDLADLLTAGATAATFGMGADIGRNLFRKGARRFDQKVANQANEVIDEGLAPQARTVPLSERRPMREVYPEYQQILNESEDLEGLRRRIGEMEGVTEIQRGIFMDRAERDLHYSLRRRERQARNDEAQQRIQELREQAEGSAADNLFSRQRQDPDRFDHYRQQMDEQYRGLTGEEPPTPTESGSPPPPSDDTNFAARQLRSAREAGEFEGYDIGGIALFSRQPRDVTRAVFKELSDLRGERTVKAQYLSAESAPLQNALLIRGNQNAARDFPDKGPRYQALTENFHDALRKRELNFYAREKGRKEVYPKLKSQYETMLQQGFFGDKGSDKYTQAQHLIENMAPGEYINFGIHKKYSLLPFGLLGLGGAAALQEQPQN